MDRANSNLYLKFSSRLGAVLCGLVAVSAPAFAAVPQDLGGTVKVDGSSTVHPITAAIAENFREVAPNVRITVGISGTGGGFKKFCAGETDLSNASRPIKSSERELCAKNGIEFLELPVAYDALTVVVNPKNTWATSLTVAELKAMWSPEAEEKITNWNQIRSSFPNKPLRLFGAGVDSGTFDYFTEAIMGKEDASRGDYSSSENDNILVQGVATDENALGFFGLAYFEQNQGKVKAVKIDDQNESNGKGAVSPSPATVVDGSYQPLSRPLFIYVRKDSVTRPEVASFMDFYLKSDGDATRRVGYVPLDEKVSAIAKARFAALTTGSVFENVTQHAGVNLVELYGKSKS
jgi:phosphate transport system substrate-binding protein